MRNRRLTIILPIVGAIALFALAMCIRFAPCLFSLLGTGESPSDPPKHPKHVEKGSPPASPAEVVLALGRREQLTVPKPVGADTCQVLIDKQGRQWVLFAKFQALDYMVRADREWSERIDITPPGWKFINRMIAVKSREGNPIVILTGFDGVPGEVVAAIHWTGEGWSTPTVLDRLELCTSVNDIVGLTDSAGRVHVVYDRPLIPQESYSIGFLVVVDGAYADKCFHVLYDGERWCTPRPTSGKGRFTVNELALSEGRGGQVCLSCNVGPFSRSQYEPGYVACQFWDGSWSQYERVSEKIPHLYEGFVVVDGWSQEHVWVPSPESGRWEYKWPQHSKSVPADAPSGKAVVVQMPDGKLAACVDGKLRVWNGAKWSEFIDLGDLPQLGSTPSGNLIAWDWRGTELVIQEVLVKNSVCPQTLPDE